MTENTTSQELDSQEAPAEVKTPAPTPHWIRVMDVVVLLGGLLGIVLFFVALSHLLPAWEEFERTRPAPTEEAENVESDGDGEVLFEFSWP